jgi:SAM-dependent methyltransferase
MQRAQGSDRALIAWATTSECLEYMDDIPSPIDLRNMADAQNWAEAAMVKRPWRKDFFEAIVRELSTLAPTHRSILELGSGPGFLAERVLTALPDVTYVAFDFSPAMHTLARQRLGSLASRVRFWEANFKDPQWAGTLPTVDAVVTLQAVHELRHKRHAPAFYAQARPLLRAGGILLVSDHFVGAGGMVDTALFMTPEEHESALLGGGFSKVRLLRQDGGLVLFRAEESIAA